jgi:parvulin-like peptidyl-prolyl isomerase
MRSGPACAKCAAPLRPGTRDPRRTPRGISHPPAPPATDESVPSMKLLRTLAAVCLIAGCQGKTRQYDNPVLGPAPPRIGGTAVVAMDVDAEGASGNGAPAAADGQSQIELMEYLAPDEPVPVTGPPGLVAARVNGTPILFADLLGQHAPKLASVRSRMSEREFRRLQLQLVNRDLSYVVDQMVLADAVMSKLDAEHKANVEQQLDKFFKQNVQQLMQQHQVSSEAELEALLQANGSSLAAERKAFGERELAQQFIAEKLKGDVSVSRRDLLTEYHDHLDEFTHPEQVKWQQIVIQYAKHEGRDGALGVADTVLGELQRGMDFDEAARRYSEEPLGKSGGHWDWTQPGSVADPELRRTLGELAVSETSGGLPGEKSWVIVKVTGKRPERTTPFVEVQDELRKRIEERRRKDRIKAVLDEARASAVVETMFDAHVAEP